MCVRVCVLLLVSRHWLVTEEGIWMIRAGRSVATVTEACMDRYECVHEVKARP